MLDDKPILVHTIDAIVQSNLIDEIVVVVTPGDQQYCKKIIEPYSSQRLDRGEPKLKLVEGGKTRQGSVFNGLQLAPEDCERVLIHDGVRPFVNSEMIEKLLRAADRFGAATAAVPVKDTIKIADEDGFVLNTPDRENLWATQTPQTFRYELIKRAHQRAKDLIMTARRSLATDDASLVERLGYKVKIIMGSYENIKITTPEDLSFARSLIKAKN